LTNAHAPTLPHLPIPCVPGPVGARLQSYWRNWQAIGADPWVVQVLRDGYLLPFDGDGPPLSTDPPALSYKRHHPLFSDLQVQVTALLEKRAIEVAPATPGFYCRLFLAPKKGGEWRPVLDLSPLNQYITAPHFRMETAQSIMAAMRIGQWATSLDLKDAFLHVPIAVTHRRYLRFMVGGIHYQFRSLPFGLTTSPYVFTRIVKAVGAYVRANGVSLLQYLDDWNTQADGNRVSQSQTNYLSQVTTGLGLLLNLGKSELVPAQRFNFVGMDIDLVEGLARPAAHRALVLSNLVESFLSLPEQPAHFWQQILGHLTSLEKLVPRGRLHMRPIQFCLTDQWTQLSGHPSALVTTSNEAREALRWWISQDHLLRGMPFSLPDVDLRLFTDASTEGWGAHLLDLRAEGIWSTSQKALHINQLELLAVHLALKQFRSRVIGSHVIAMTDNTTVVGQISNQGGTHSRALYLLTRDLLLWCDANDVLLSARHIPGRLNVLADRLSRRHQVIQTEWSLMPTVAARMWKVWGAPHVDLFATDENHKLPVYVSPLPDESAWRQDAFSFPWTNLWAYAYPPTALVSQALECIARNPCEVIMVAPAWPSQPWFNRLLELCVDHPRKLPPLRTLLRQPGTNQFHPDPSRLCLHAWRLSSLPSAVRAFQEMCPSASQPDTGSAPGPSMIVAGASFATGAPLRVQIHSLQLPR